MLPELESLKIELDENRRLLADTLRDLSDDEMQRAPRVGEYAGREMLAHLAGAERGMTRLMQNMAAGKNPRLRADYDNDVYNARQQEKRARMTSEQLLDELQQSRAELLAFMETLTGAQLDLRGEHPTVGDASVRDVLITLQTHERAHIQEFGAWADEMRAAHGAGLKELQPFIDQMNLSREKLWKALDGLSIEQLLEPMPNGDWSIKDALAHIVMSEPILTETLRRILAGKDASVPPDFDTDEANAVQVAGAKAMSLAELWLALDEDRTRLFKLLDAVTPEQVARRGAEGNQGALTVKEFLTVMYAHEEMHAREIVAYAWRLKRAETAPQ
jgi:uncharacterized damage-inducible protein DinB